MNICHLLTAKKMTAMALVMLFGSLLISCDSPYTAHAYKDYPDGMWMYDSVAVFDFKIDNTAPSYDILYHIRNTRDYPYYNLYVKCSLLDKEGKIVRQKQHEAYLMHPQTGAPLGNGKSLYEHEIKLWEGYQFQKNGQYQLRIKQYMRLDTLQGVNAVGFSVMPVNPSK